MVVLVAAFSSADLATRFPMLSVRTVNALVVDGQKLKKKEEKKEEKKKEEKKEEEEKKKEEKKKDIGEKKDT